MWRRLKPRVKAYVKFFRQSLSQQLPHAKYKPAMTWAWRLGLFVILFVVADYFGVPLRQLVAPVYHLLPVLWWVIILLSLAILFLLFVIDGARRYHLKTVSDLHAVQYTVALRVLRLGEVVGRGSQIDQECDNHEDQAPKEIFETWVTYLKMALRDTYGPNAISDFTNGHPEFLDVPDQRHVWFLHLRQRVSEVIDREMRVIKQSRADLDRLQ
jgi:hypothetical protein